MNFFFCYNFKETILSVQYTHITESTQSVTIDEGEVKVCCHGNRLGIHFLISRGHLEKRDTLHIPSSATRMFLAARSLCTKDFWER